MSNTQDFGQIVGTVPYWDARDGTGDLWDLLMLGDSVMPGITRIKSQGRGKDVDAKKSKGSDGAELSDDGIKPTRVTITTKIWTAEQFNELQRILPSITPSKLGAERAAVPALHPQLQLLGITHLYIVRQGTLEIDEMGLGTIEFEAIEWVPKPAETPKGSGGSTALSPTNQLLAIFGEAALKGIFAEAFPNPVSDNNLDESLSGYAD